MTNSESNKDDKKDKQKDAVKEDEKKQGTVAVNADPSGNPDQPSQSAEQPIGTSLVDDTNESE